MSHEGFISSLDVEVITIKIFGQSEFCIDKLLQRVSNVSKGVEEQRQSIDFNNFHKIIYDTINELSEDTTPSTRIALHLILTLQEYHSSYEEDKNYIEAGNVLDIINALFRSEINRRKKKIIVQQNQCEAILKKAHESQRSNFEKGNSTDALVITVLD